MNARTLALAVFILALTALGDCRAQGVGLEAPLPRVLLIGDSICGGYHQAVIRALQGQAEVVKNRGNAQFTGFGVETLEEWLGEGAWDVIHFNWGLWDMYGWEHAAQDRSPAAYAKRLEQIVGRLQNTGATLIWATTTPACPAAERTMRDRFDTELQITPEVERQYLDAARRVMERHGVRINDLHALLRPVREKYTLAPDDVHFNRAGSDLLAEQVVMAVRDALADRGPSPGVERIRMRTDFGELGLGMFIHFNMATYHETQWVAGYVDPASFDPGGVIDTDAWAEAAVAAGMTYGVLTAKHVSGFCLWDSAYTTFDVMHPDCPYQRDLVGQFVESFTKRGLAVGLYYCWRSPGFKSQFKVLPPECDPASHELAEQVAFQKQQVAELVARYPQVFYIWNDALDPMVMPADAAQAFFQGLERPVLASSNWWDWGKKGTPFVDIPIKEMRHFPEVLAIPGETCWKIEQRWFWQQGAEAGKAEALLRHFATARSRNSTFLLNVGPDRQGRILESSRKVLAEIGTARDGRAP